MIIGSCSYDSMPDLWFAEGYIDNDRQGSPNLYEQKVALVQTMEAVRICNSCEVMEECREAGMSEQYGVWGGLMPGERILERGDEINKNNISSVRFAAKVRALMEDDYEYIEG